MSVKQKKINLNGQCYESFASGFLQKSTLTQSALNYFCELLGMRNLREIAGKDTFDLQAPTTLLSNNSTPRIT
jgi:hypothetical protein